MSASAVLESLRVGCETALVVALVWTHHRMRRTNVASDPVSREAPDAAPSQRPAVGVIVTCSYCHRVQDAGGQWRTLPARELSRREAELSHGVCPRCLHQHYPDVAARLAH